MLSYFCLADFSGQISDIPLLSSSEVVFYAPFLFFWMTVLLFKSSSFLFLSFCLRAKSVENSSLSLDKKTILKLTDLLFSLKCQFDNVKSTNFYLIQFE